MVWATGTQITYFNKIRGRPTSVSDPANFIDWYKINGMLANPANFKVMFLGKGNLDQIDFEIGNISLNN